VDRQAECRLSYFLQYGLRTKERKEATVDPAEFGTYVHYVLEQTARDVMQLGGFQQVDLEKTLEIAQHYSQEYTAEHFSQLESQRMEYLFRRNMRELELVVQELWEELHDATFAPERFELNFATDGEMGPIHIPGAAIPAQLRGFVDRVDLWQQHGQNYVRVVDYKTGKKDFDYCDVFNGVGLQMLLYLFALEDGGVEITGANAVPAGVQYFPARVPYITAQSATDDSWQDQRKKQWVRKGLLLRDEDALKAMDPTEKLDRLNCKRNKDGDLVGDLADRAQLKQLKRYVMDLLRRMVNDIASGNVQPNPYTRGSTHDACTFCPYGSVCHKEYVQGRRNYKTMTQDRFWEEIGKEVDSRG
jgi:ATP-dependent helicase/nuclease subunit B